MTIMVGELVLLFSGNSLSPSALSSSDYHGPRVPALARATHVHLGGYKDFFFCNPIVRLSPAGFASFWWAVFSLFSCSREVSGMGAALRFDWLTWRVTSSLVAAIKFFDSWYMAWA